LNVLFATRATTLACNWKTSRDASRLRARLAARRTRPRALELAARPRARQMSLKKLYRPTARVKSKSSAKSVRRRRSFVRSFARARNTKRALAP